MRRGYLSENEEMHPDQWLLQSMLWLAVPLWIDIVSKWTSRQRLASAQECANILAPGGAGLMWRTKTTRREMKWPGEPSETVVTHGTADTFNALARGMACLCVESGQSLEDVMRQWLGSKAA